MTWINTYTGRKVFPLDLKPEDVCLRDIAHSLAGKMRYMGHCWVTVAQHSVVVSRCVAALGGSHDLVRYALMHDAHEAYFPDMPRPLKEDPRMAWFLDTEARAQTVVLEALKVSLPSKEDAARVHALDVLVCSAEARAGFSEIHKDWKLGDAPKELEGVIRNNYSVLYEPSRARIQFMDVCRKLGFE